MKTLRSPYRYPGGKTKLTKHIIRSVEKAFNHSDKFTFVDVFVGGGSVSLGVANEYPNTSFLLNDMDEWIFSFWKSITDQTMTTELISLIKKYEIPTIEDFNELRKQCQKNDISCSYKGFLALFFNRTAFSGIFRSGPIGGYSQKGEYKIHCRYNAPKLALMTKDISDYFHNRRVKILQQDFKTIIKICTKKQRQNCLMYLDPPYMTQGKQLYNHFMQYKDYEEMANALKNTDIKWIISHDDCPDFINMYKGWANIKTIEGVPYTINSIKNKRKTELIISNY